MRGTPGSSGSNVVAVGATVLTVVVGLTVIIGVALGGTSILGGPRVSKAEIQAKNSKDFNSAKARWEDRGYDVNLRVKDDENCLIHSYGEVRDFFRANPCDLLSRAVFELRDKQKNVVLVAVSRVDMPGAGEASELKTLVDAGGTGNVTELSRESGPYRDVRFTGEGYTSSLSGPTVQNTQVQPVGWSAGDSILHEILGDAPALAG